MPGVQAIKLHRPPVPDRWVQRPRLLQQLNHGLALNRRVTLVSAPAGFGKTSCISEWIHSLASIPVAWLSLDPADDDPQRFLTYLIATLHGVIPSLGQELEGLLRSGQLPSTEITSTVLINDISAFGAPFILVLDDVHVIQNPLIVHIFEQLLTTFPDPLHLVMITREDPPLPLARLRANNQLTEVRAGDLRFTRRDIDGFLNDVMGLSLSQVDIAVLEEKTEGWIAGLQLAALALQTLQPSQERADPSRIVAALRGSHRFIVGYLTEQVLSQQTQEIRDFLLQTSILDRLNGDLCDRVTGRSDSHALLEQLYKANLFLIPLDDDGQWFRYYHLFGDYLRTLQSRVAGDLTARLHQRACHWYAQAGLASQAMQHALAAKDYVAAVALLEEHAMHWIAQGYAQTVHDWVHAIPDWVEYHSPKTDLAFAWMHLLRGAYSQAAPYLARLEQFFASQPADMQDHISLKSEWLVMQSLLLNLHGKPSGSLALVRQALEMVPAQDSQLRSLVHFGLGCAYQMLEEDELGIKAYQTAIQCARAAGNPLIEMLSTSNLAVIAFEHGRLKLAYEVAAPVSARVEKSGTPPPISTVVHGILAEIYYQWHQPGQARHYSQHALQLSTVGGYNSGIAGCRVLLSRLELLEGNLDAAGREIQIALDLVQKDVPGYLRQEVVAQQVRLDTAQGRFAAAQLALQGQGFSFAETFSHPELLSRDSISHSLGLLANSSLRFLLYQAQAKEDPAALEAAVGLASQVVQKALTGSSILVAVEALLLQAQMHELAGDHPASQAGVAKALELSEPEGILGVFIEQGPPMQSALAGLLGETWLGAAPRAHAHRILQAFSGSGLGDGAQPPVSAHLGEASTGEVIEPLIEPLTGRELEVLRLMAAGLKHKEVAARLFISLNTVRTHAKSIYSKLGASSRMRAIARARRLKIL